MRRRQIFTGIAVLVSLGFVGAAFLFGGANSVVLWRNIRGVAIESDDWGLAGFIPTPQALVGLDVEQLGPGHFPAVYWGSTLEDSTMVADLAALLAGFRGSDGLPAVLQPNYVLGSLTWEGPTDSGHWCRHYWPEFSSAYARPGLVQAVEDARAKGVWYPEYHALYHYEAAKRISAVASRKIAAQAAQRDVMLFPGSEKAWELAPDRPLPELARELDLGLDVFRKAFGKPVESMIAPDYTWDAGTEKLWLSRGLHVIQAKREQRYPARGWGLWPRVRKAVEQRWEKLIHRDRVYLERNCRFEPVQYAEPAAVVQRCYQEVRSAWRHGEPAIIEAHRINFVHTDPSVVETGQLSLHNLLAKLEQDRGSLPMYMVDSEIASLDRNGTSRRLSQGQLILRNMTMSGRLVVCRKKPSQVQMCFLPAGSVEVVKARGTGLWDSK